MPKSIRFVLAVFVLVLASVSHDAGVQAFAWRPMTSRPPWMMSQRMPWGSANAGGVGFSVGGEDEEEQEERARGMGGLLRGLLRERSGVGMGGQIGALVGGPPEGRRLGPMGGLLGGILGRQGGRQMSGPLGAFFRGLLKGASASVPFGGEEAEEQEEGTGGMGGQRGGLMSHGVSGGRGPFQQIPQMPQPIFPQNSQPIFPQMPQPIFPQMPQPILLQMPQPIIPQMPQPIIPHMPQFIIPQVSLPTIPQVPQTFIPQVPQQQVNTPAVLPGSGLPTNGTGQVPAVPQNGSHPAGGSVSVPNAPTEVIDLNMEVDDDVRPAGGFALKMWLCDQQGGVCAYQCENQSDTISSVDCGNGPQGKLYCCDQ